MKLFRLSNGNNIEEIDEHSYRDKEVDGFGETTLQQLLADYPEIIPSAEMNNDDPPKFLLIKKEAGITAGSMDILLVDHNGTPTIVETKLIDNREIRRSVLAQGIEYLSHLKTEWSAQKFYDEGRMTWGGIHSVFEGEAVRRLQLPFDEEFIEKLQSNIDSNKMRLIIAADRLPPELVRVVEFLNETSEFDVLGIEVKYFVSSENKYKVLASHLVGQTETTKERKSSTSQIRIEYLNFYQNLSNKLKDKIPLPLRSAHPRSYYQVPTGIGGIHFEFAFHGQPRSSFEIGLHLERSDKSFNKNVLENLKQLKNQIEQITGEKVFFQENWGQKWSKLYLEKNEGSLTEELLGWAVDKMVKFYQVLKPELEKIKKENAPNNPSRG